MFSTKDLLVIIPTKGRPDMLNTAVQSFLRTTTDSQLCVTFDDEKETYWNSPRVSSLRTPERMGYWGVLNYTIDLFPYPLVGYFANDVIFHPGWEGEAVKSFNKHFPDGRGLLALQDDVWGDFHAAHGIISLSWLDVLYGRPEFPGIYGHHYGDSELTQFTKDLHRFKYCPTARVEHLHPDKDKRERDEIDNMAGDILSPKEAKQLYDARYLWWDREGRREAKDRL